MSKSRKRLIRQWQRFAVEHRCIEIAYEPYNMTPIKANFFADPIIPELEKEEAHIHEYLVRLMMEDIKENNLITFNKEIDPLSRKLIYSGTIYVGKKKE